jgi:hypothetical protein
MQFSLVPERQKCQAIQFEFEERNTYSQAIHEPDYAIGRGWVISGIDIEYSPKSGTGTKNMSKGSTR